MVIILVVLVGLALDPWLIHPSVPAVLTLALQILHCLPGTKRFRGRWSLAAQAALFPWAGPPGFLAASVLLIVPGRIRWPLFGAVVAAAGLLNLGDVYACANAMGNALAIGVTVYGLTRLSDLRAELRAARGALAAESVAGERERFSRDLDAALGSALSEIAGLAARGRVERILTIARESAARVRATPAAPVEPPPADLTPRLALPIVVAAHLEYLAVGAIVLGSASPPALILATDLTALAVVIGLSVYHCLPRPPGVRPRYAGWTLSAQTVLACLPLLAPGGPEPRMVGFAAGSILIILGGRLAWTLSGIVVVSVPVILLVRSVPLGETASLTVDTGTIALIFYGLALLTGLVHEIREARLALAAMALARERRRIARDVHDLLGYGLSAIIVKAELAARDPARAERELAGIVLIARRALGDLRAIPGDDPRMSLRAELASACDVLAAAGIAARADASADGLPGPVDALLATVLREAVTNVLRHSRARTCSIEVTVAGGTTRLRVTNDGVPGTPAGTGGPGVTDVGVPGAPAGAGGQGVGNLTERVAAMGGRLTAGPRPGGEFELLVLQPAGLGGDADRVDAVAGVQLGDDRR
ncbi:histidine kinase [Actinoallomurus spadix]|uniref:Signal transduction histidine kinase subgroup 3 dimerisation and phosphoacceptor domain-containing protein n=1 Tax=Actinoallomurus spadix TaxID=79912 RepID=A0ABP3HIQ4_9ACTN|nr:histidine kinase [Actinoallomurus spadix]MCO5990249.1 histidine kinase [Actinoallomurus spadix]